MSIFKKWGLGGLLKNGNRPENPCYDDKSYIESNQVKVECFNDRLKSTDESSRRIDDYELNNHDLIDYEIWDYDVVKISNKKAIESNEKEMHQLAVCMASFSFPRKGDVFSGKRLIITDSMGYYAIVSEDNCLQKTDVTSIIKALLIQFPLKNLYAFVENINDVGVSIKIMTNIGIDKPEYILDGKKITKKEFVKMFNLTEKVDIEVNNLITQMVSSGVLKQIKDHSDGSDKLTREDIIKKYNLSGQTKVFIDIFIRGLEESNPVETESVCEAIAVQSNDKQCHPYNGITIMRSRFIWDKSNINVKDDVEGKYIEMASLTKQYLHSSSRFYLTYYICPQCKDRLLYKTNTMEQFTVITNVDEAIVTSVFTCEDCRSFYAAKPGTSLSDGDGFKIERLTEDSYINLLRDVESVGVVG